MKDDKRGQIIDVTIANPSGNDVEVLVELLYYLPPNEAAPVPPSKQISRHIVRAGKTQTDTVSFTVRPNPVLLTRPYARVIGHRTL